MADDTNVGISTTDAESKLADLFSRGSAPAAEPKQKADPEPAAAQAPDEEADTDTRDHADDPDNPAEDDLSDAERDAKAALAGDDPDAPVAAKDAPAEDEESDFEYNGKQYKVPKPLVEGALRQADYTKKTQEVADLRRVTVAERANVMAEAQAIQVLAPAMTQLQNIEQLIGEINTNMPDPFVDTPGYLAADKRLKELATAQKNLAAAIDSKRTELVQEKQARDKELLTASLTVIQREIPKWSPALASEIGKFVMDIGYTDAELKQTFDPRFVKIAHKAMLYDKLEKSKPVMRQKVGIAAPVVRPKGVVNTATVQSNRVADAKQKAVRSGRTEDAEAAMLAVLTAAARRKR